MPPANTKFGFGVSVVGGGRYDRNVPDCQQRAAREDIGTDVGVRSRCGLGAAITHDRNRWGLGWLGICVRGSKGGIVRGGHGNVAVGIGLFPAQCRRPRLVRGCGNTRTRCEATDTQTQNFGSTRFPISRNTDVPGGGDVRTVANVSINGRVVGGRRGVKRSRDDPRGGRTWQPRRRRWLQLPIPSD